MHLNPDKEARLAEIAVQRGLKTDELAQQILDGYLDYDDRFLEAVDAGLVSADRGEFVEHEEVWARVEQILRS